jgi:hypothetical protein
MQSGMKYQVQIQNRLTKPAQHRVQRTFRFAPLNRLCPLEILVPFCGLVLGETPLTPAVGRFYHGRFLYGILQGASVRIIHEV